MLTLTRRLGDSIQIGPDIFIHFVQVGRNKVSVSIDAPRDVTINRIDRPADYFKDRDGEAPWDASTET